MTGVQTCALPISKVICTYPKLIAAYHVLHRLLMPRHSPCALCSLTYSVKNFQSFAFNITKNISWLTSQYILKLYYIIHMQFSKNKLVGLNGLEPSTSRLSGVRSNQLSYNPLHTVLYISQSAGSFLYKSGSHLLSHTVSSIVSSAA